MWNPQTAYQDQAIAAQYDAARWTSISGRRGARKEFRAMSRALAEASDAKMALDVPCGTGRITAQLLARGLSVAGVDISLQMMAQARVKTAQFPNATGLVRGNVLAIPFLSDAFDLVCCVRLFGHYESAVRVEMLKEMARVSRRYVLVQYFYETPLTRFKRAVKRNVLKTYEGVVYPTTEPQLCAELQKAALRERGRFWCRKYYSEEVFMLLEKPEASRVR